MELTFERFHHLWSTAWHITVQNRKISRSVKLNLHIYVFNTRICSYQIRECVLSPTVTLTVQSRKIHGWQQARASSMYVCMHTYICIYIYIYKQIYIYILYICMYIYVYILTHMHIYEYMHKCTFKSVFVCICISINIYMCICIRTNIHVYISIHANPCI